MKKFILKTCIFLTICIILDIIIGIGTDFLHKSSKGGIIKKDEYIKDKLHADIVIIGSSRAAHHYVSNLLADSLGCTVYNTGIDGKGIIMNYGVLLEITNRYIPKTIIYELTPILDYLKRDNEKDLINLKHAYGIRGIDSIFWDVNHNERIKMISRSYRINSLLPAIISCNIFTENDTLNGYVPLWNRLEGKRSNKVFDTESLDTLKLKYLQKFINLCRKDSINLIFAISPSVSVQK